MTNPKFTGLPPYDKALTHEQYANVTRLDDWKRRQCEKITGKPLLPPEAHLPRWIGFVVGFAFWALVVFGITGIARIVYE